MPDFIAGLREAAERYDGFILDLWGVLHDGIAPFPGVVETLERVADADKRIVILSNAPRRAEAVADRVAEIGIPRRLYQGLVSSGEEAWQRLRRRDDAFHAALGRRVFHIGPPRDHGMLDGLDLDKVTEIAEADFILNTGPWGWEETPENYEVRLAEAKGRDLPMVCANPDLVVMNQNRLMICAGTLADLYERMGGRVSWHGKPYRAVYERCFEILRMPERSRVLAVGDSLRTDIAGANRVGIDALLIAGGIHAEEFGVREGEIPDRARVRLAIDSSGHRPNYVMPHFAW